MKLETVLVAMVAIALAAPLSILGTLSSSKVVEVPQAALAAPLEGLAAPPVQNGNLDSRTVTAGEARHGASWWERFTTAVRAFPLDRTLTRLGWLVAGAAPFFFEENAERRATETGQWDSYVAFRDALRQGFTETRDGSLAMVQALPSLVVSLKEDPTAIPALAVAMVFGGLTSTLEQGHALVYGDDIAAGHAAGSMVFELWVTGAVGGGNRLLELFAGRFLLLA